VVGGEEDDSVGEGVFGGVGEEVGGLAGDDGLVVEEFEVGVEGNFAEGNDDLEFGEGGEFAVGVYGAVGEFGGKGLVVGRGTADGGGDPHIAKTETVVAIERGWLGGESEAVEDRVHEFGGGVSGERTTGAIAAVGSGGEAEDEDAGVGIAKAGNGARPVFAGKVGATLFAANALTVFDEAGATTAGDYVGFEGFEEGERVAGWRHREPQPGIYALCCT
jgi:hypothetical protein